MTLRIKTAGQSGQRFMADTMVTTKAATASKRNTVNTRSLL
jgi:hypothetical protein